MDHTTDTSNIKQLVETYSQRIWDEKDLTVIDELLHPNCVIHSLLGAYHGPEAMKNVVKVWLEGFPDLTVKNTSVICEGNLVVTHWQAKGTHLGKFKGVKPTGKSIFYGGVTIYRISNAKIAEYWAYLDMQQLLKQISLKNFLTCDV